MILEQYPELGRLTPSQKLILVSELWDDLAATPEQVPVTPEQIEELDRRMAAYRQNPGQVTTWMPPNDAFSEPAPVPHEGPRQKLVHAAFTPAASRSPALRRSSAFQSTGKEHKESRHSHCSDDVRDWLHVRGGGAAACSKPPCFRGGAIRRD